MRRTMTTGAFKMLMTVDNLHPDLGSRFVRSMVSFYLPIFLDHDLNVRGGMASFEDMMVVFIHMLEIQEDFYRNEKKRNGSESEV
ncbi:unnamed protein product [Ectocarpus sp. 12 AP-2014]